MATTCAVDWCVCIPTTGSIFCKAHKADPKLKPLELEPDEELAPAEAADDDCEDCDGSGKCDCCDGDGEAEYKCSKCYDYHTATCHACDGDGVCPTCEGAKSQGVRKKPEGEIRW